MQTRARRRPRWLKVEEIADRLRVELPEADALVDNDPPFAVLILPGGSKRIDAASFQQFERAHRLGLTTRTA